MKESTTSVKGRTAPVKKAVKIRHTTGWLFQNLFAARVTVSDEGGLNVSVDVAMRASEFHAQLAALHPILVLEDGTEVPLFGIEQDRTSGFPLRCRAEAAMALAPSRDGRLPVTHVRVTYKRRIKNLPNILRSGA